MTISSDQRVLIDLVFKVIAAAFMIGGACLILTRNTDSATTGVAELKTQYADLHVEIHDGLAANQKQLLQALSEIQGQIRDLPDERAAVATLVHQAGQAETAINALTAHIAVNDQDIYRIRTDEADDHARIADMLRASGERLRGGK